jgi:hypothetical protein
MVVMDTAALFTFMMDSFDFETPLGFELFSSRGLANSRALLIHV